jgi:hypothetical protein
MNRVSVSCKSSFQLYIQRSTASIVKRHVSSIVPAIFSPSEHVAGQIHDSSLDYQFIQTTRPSSLSDLDRLSMYRVQHPHLPAPTCIPPPLSAIVDASNCTVATTKCTRLSQLLHARPNSAPTPRFPMLPTPTSTIPSLPSLPCRLPQTVHPTTLSLIHSHSSPTRQTTNYIYLSLLLSLTLPTRPTH